MALVHAGATFAEAGEPVATVYFAESGLLAYVREMTTGHHLAVAAVGVEDSSGPAA